MLRLVMNSVSYEEYVLQKQNKKLSLSTLKNVLQAGCISFSMKNHKTSKETRKTYHGITVNGTSMLHPLYLSFC